MEIFRIFGSIFLKSDEADKTLDKIDKKAQGLDKTFAKIGKGMSDFGSKLSLMVTLPIVGAGGAAIKLASDMEESINKVNVAFKSSGKDVLNWSNTTLESFGIAKGSALDMAALFGDMGTAMGQTPMEAAKMSKSLVGLAGDLASFKNIGIEQAQDALKGIFTGEGESLKTLGVIMQDSTLEAYALATGQKKAYDEMTQAEKVALRYAFVMNATKNAQGDFARTNDGAANQMRIFQESIQELGAKFGQILLPTFTMLTTKINEVVQWFGQLNPTTQQFIVIIGLIVAAIGPLVFIIGTLISSLGAITGALAAISGPVLLVIGALAALTAAIVYLWNKNETFRTAVIAIWENIKAMALFIFQGLQDWWKVWGDTIVGMFKNYFEIIKIAVQTVFNWIKAFWQDWGPYITQLFKLTFSNIVTALKFVWDTIKNIIEIAIGVISGIIKLFLSVLKGDWQGAWDAVKDIFSAVWNGMKNQLSNSIELIKGILNNFITFAGNVLKNLWEGVKNTTVSIWDGIVGGIKSAINSIIGFINGMVQKVADGINAVTGFVNNVPGINIPRVTPPKIPMLAEGGNVMDAGRVLVGEAGPEFLDLPKGAKVSPLDKSEGGITININNPHLFNERDADKLGQLIVGRLRTATGLRI